MAASVLVLLVGAAPAFAEGGAAKIVKLNKQGLDAFDNLNFDQAKTLFEQALSESDAAGLANDPAVARTHLNLGMLLIAGFQQREQAVEHFKAALKIQPDITPPAGLFNPEVQAAFDETKANQANQPRQSEPPKTPPKAVKGQTPSSSKDNEVGGGPEGEVEEEGGEEEAPSGSTPRFFLSLGLGSGFGVAKGHLDANKDVSPGNPPTGAAPSNSWSGGLAPSALGHIMLGAGYFVSPALLLSLEGRIQIITGTTKVSPPATCTTCPPASTPPSTGIAVLAKANWYFSPGPLRPFVSGGLGAGSIRQVVSLNVKTDPTNPNYATTHCGDGGKQACVDTVTGGPVLLAAGAGVAYEMGSLVLLGTLTANVGVPNFMFNLDALLGLGMRL